MKRFFLTLFVFGVLFLLNFNPLAAVTYEVGFRVLNDNEQYVNIPIEVRERDGGALVGNYSSSGSGTYNFRIDLNTDVCNEYQVCLEPGVVYVIAFNYGGQIGEKSLYYTRDTVQCNPYNNDTFYTVTPSSVTRDDSNPCEPEDVWGYSDAFPYYPLTLSSIEIYDVEVLGDKTIYRLKATAGGGDRNYEFTWTNATPTTSAATNPNTAYRLIFQESITVNVEVTSNGESKIKSITLPPDPE